MTAAELLRAKVADFYQRAARSFGIGSDMHVAWLQAIDSCEPDRGCDLQARDTWFADLQPRSFE